jgi:Family of unknown function (DUF6636)
VRGVRRTGLIVLGACAVIALCLPASGSARIKQSFFHTLDGNISCGMIQDKKPRRKHHRKIPGFPGVARCDLQNHTWVAPPKPKSCPVDWGFGVEVTRRGSGRYVCAGDTVANPSAPALGPGAVVTVGRYTCSVLATSVRCTNNLSSHGFEVSADAVSLF